ncbi:MAG: hypothetical protein HQL24_08920 [Candidatus Omnitrophica bacterium]|nr:hypothetical protein [Candidatus Omnitrophota bacterium]
MKKKLVLVLIVLACVTVFCLVRDIVIKNVATAVTSDIVGAPVHIGGLSLSIVRQSIKITDFKMYSPKGFPSEVMVDIPLLYVSCDVFSLFKGKAHFKALSLDLKEIVLAKNKERKTNVGTLKIFEKKGPLKLMPMQMDLVLLSVGRIVSKDYGAVNPPDIKVYDVGFKTTYRNVNSVEQLAALIISEPLKSAGIRQLSQYGVSMLTGVAALPVAAAFALASKDYSREDYSVSWSKAFDVGLKVLKDAGKIKDENKETGVINADVRGFHVTLRLRKLSWLKTQVTISARRFMLPQPEVAAGVMYRISEELK